MKKLLILSASAIFSTTILCGQVNISKHEKFCNGESTTDIEEPFLYSGSIEQSKSFKGSYKNGQKRGTWIYYSQDGKIIEKRKHTDNLHYSSKNTKGLPTNTTTSPNGLKTIHKINSQDVLWSARFYQYVEFDKMTEWDGTIVKQAIENLIANGNATFFADSELKEKISFDITQLNNYAFIGILTKSDFFVDKSRLLTDQRIISFQLIGKNAQTEQIEVLPALYYPEVRAELAKFPLTYNGQKITVDDLFYNNYFRGPVRRYTQSEPIVFSEGDIFNINNCFLYNEYTSILFIAENQLRGYIEKIK